MTSKAFKSFISRLESYYSGTGNSITVDEWALKEYYNACFCVFDKDVQPFYSELVSHFKFFPRVSEFREVAEKYRKGERKHYANDGFCYCCMNTGVVPYIKKGIHPFTDYEYDFVSRCYCEAGKNKPDWPLCTSVVTQGELDWLVSENHRKFGNASVEEGQTAKQYVTRFIKGF